MKPTEAERAAARQEMGELMTQLYAALYAVDPMIRHHPTARWELSLDTYRAARRLSTIVTQEEVPTAEEMASWEISPGDMLLGVLVTEGQGEPRIVADCPPPIRLEDYVPAREHGKPPSFRDQLLEYLEAATRANGLRIGEWHPDTEPADHPSLHVQRVEGYLPVSEEILMDEGVIPDTRPPRPRPLWRSRLRWRVGEARDRAARWAYKVISGYAFPEGDD